VCELVGPAGEVRSAETVDWRGIDLAAAFADIAPARVESDVRAAALAESRHGAARDRPDFLYVSVGSGISHCLMVDGRPRLGVRGAAIGTGSAATLVEVAGRFIRKDVAQPNLLEYTDRFIKYVWSVFFFILINNLLGLLPIAAVSGRFGLHLGGTATGNVWVTATLALMTFALMVFNGIRLGGKHYFAHFCPGPLWLSPILVPVELAGLIAKIFALTVRLFANMLAGHILLAVLLGFILSAFESSQALGFGIAVPAVLGSVAITMLEIFVAFLQAFIFTFLTCLFIGQSIVFHHGDDHGDEHGHGHQEAAAHH